MLLVEGHGEHDDLGLAQQVGQVVDAVDPGAGCPGDRRDVAAERREPGGDRATHSPEADDQHTPVGQRRVGRMHPPLRVLGADEVGDPALRCQHEGEGELCRAVVVDAAGVAQRHPVRQVAQHVLVAGGEGLQNPQPWQGSDGVERGGVERVGQHVHLHDVEHVGVGQVAGLPDVGRDRVRCVDSERDEDVHARPQPVMRA